MIPQPRDLEDIQGLVYSGWADHRYAGFQFVRFGDDARSSRAWLRSVLGDITRAAPHRRPSHGRLSLALTATGLAALGVPADVIGMLPAEAQAGMAARRRCLGDGDSATWQLGRDRLDALVMVYACEASSRAKYLAGHRSALAAAGAHVCPDELSEPIGSREHFGFADGLSQPYLPGLHAEPRRGEDPVAPGEILLGYPNAYDRQPMTPMWGDTDLGRNGSFLVFRKLAQDVAALWHWIASNARELAGGDSVDAAVVSELTDLIAAKLVGRWPSGAPLALCPDYDDLAYATPDRLNAFQYLVHDPDGLRCPISSHVRRANPRDARGGTAEESAAVVRAHRILRRGRSYGTRLDRAAALAGHDDGIARGLYFICLQASIARGFEFIQQSWLGNPGFGGLHQEPDPIIGNRRNSHITIPAEPVRLRLANPPTTVTNLGGGYFFLPSLTALTRIADGP